MHIVLAAAGATSTTAQVTSTGLGLGLGLGLVLGLVSVDIMWTLLLQIVDVSGCSQQWLGKWRTERQRCKKRQDRPKSRRGTTVYRPVRSCSSSSRSFSNPAVFVARWPREEISIVRLRRYGCHPSRAGGWRRTLSALSSRRCDLSQFTRHETWRQRNGRTRRHAQVLTVLSPTDDVHSQSTKFRRSSASAAVRAGTSTRNVIQVD